MRGSSLKAKSARGAMALGAGTVVERGLRFGRNMILARVLAPDQFGLMAIVMVVANMFEAFTEVGIKQSVVQNKRGAEHDYLNVAWWFQVVRGLALFVIALAAAPWISSFYGKPELSRLLQVAFLAILFRGLVSPRAYVLEKRYRFDKVVLLVQGSGVFGSIVAVVLGLVLQSVWALVIGFVAEFAMMCVLSYVFVPVKPTFRINREDMAELFRFARAMFGLPVLAIIAQQTDVLVLGKVVAEDDLGMYFLAVALVNLPVFLFSRIANPVLLPAFSEKQDEKDSLCWGILQVTKTAAMFGVPLVAFMASCAGGILLLAYGPKYVGAAAPLALLSLLVVTRCQGAILASAYLAVGRPHLHRRCCVLRAVIIVGLIYPAVVHLGLLGAAIVVVLGSLVAVLMQVYWCRRIVDLKLGVYTRCYLPGLLLALPIILTFVILWLFHINHLIYVLSIEAFIFIATFIVGFFVWNRTRLLAVAA